MVFLSSQFVFNMIHKFFWICMSYKRSSNSCFYFPTWPISLQPNSIHSTAWQYSGAKTTIAISPQGSRWRSPQGKRTSFPMSCIPGRSYGSTQICGSSISSRPGRREKCSGWLCCHFLPLLDLTHPWSALLLPRTALSLCLSTTFPMIWNASPLLGTVFTTAGSWWACSWYSGQHLASLCLSSPDHCNMLYGTFVMAVDRAACVHVFI